MAFVARNDQHGNEIMRVMLSTEPGKLTVASCQNLRINCAPQQAPMENSEGRYDHRQRFHYYADDSQTWRHRAKEQKSHSVVVPIAQQEREMERQRTHKRLREKQSLSDDESAGWNTAEIIAHSTLDSARKPLEVCTSRRDNSATFNSWLAEKNKSQQQQAEDRRLIAQQEDQRAEERARLAHEKYQNWLNAKSNSTKVRRAKSDLSSALASTTTTSRQSLPADEAQRRLHDWERVKLAAMKAQRQRRKDKQQQQELMETARRELSAEAWEQWVDASRTKPRPVPMGQGLDSLRGSMAPLYTNPHEWQPIVAHVKRNPQLQSQPQLGGQGEGQGQGQSTTARNGPDYERLERLAQPRRKQCRPTSREEKLNESVKTLDETLAPKSANCSVARQSSAPEVTADLEESPKVIEAEPVDMSIVTEKEVEQQMEDPSEVLEPRGKPIIWSKNNAQRVRELREVISPLDDQMPLQLRDDQVEQLRKHQDLQNSKVLPRKYQVKREKLREKLKAWVEEGKLLPERSATDEKSPKPNQSMEISQGPEINTNESKGQRSEDQMQSTARKSVSTEIRGRSTDPARLLKLKDSKGTTKSRPWR
ncbi:uncharacterized protein LOC117785827 [Drosophila innubila]|uniref:uncharacterized protein LOC117785827 n=1 Tax=Drosophila innubila TaxID=198719 RepID=UPI00148C4696|nr:uncharacterized protein LOC117785827 [Drosophila innubila]